MNWSIQIVAKIVLFFSVILSFSVQSFIAMWVLLELNFLAFIFILSKSFVVKASNKTLNYFLVQAIGSGLVLIVIFMFFMRVSHTLLMVMYFLALLMKLGGVPFHNWYLKLVQKLSWEMIWVLSVWQKLIPLLMLSKPSFNLTLLASVLSVALSSISSISQKNIKKILGLSSIFSLGWILVSFELSKTIWLQFILGYGASLAILLGSLILSNQGVSQNFNKDLGSSHLVIFFLGFLMLSGIPPFIGFFLKMLILFNLTHLSLILVLLFLVFSVILIFVYLNITFLLFTFVVNKFSFSSLIDHSSYFFLDLVILNLFLSILLLMNFCN